MTRISCQLECRSSAEHLTQIYSGFGALAKQGKLGLRVRKASIFQPGINGDPRLLVTVGDNLKLVFDASDSTNLDKQAIESCDCYFKRSFDPEVHRRHPLHQKIRPLGFNYPVYVRGDFAGRRCVWSWLSSGGARGWASVLLTARQSRLLSRLCLNSNGRYNCSLERLEAVPFASPTPQVLFLTRLWNPDRAKTTEQKREREQLNQTRADCIRKLQRGFGKNFVGGVESTDYARKCFGDCVVDARLTKKRAYLEIVKQASVCISTTGLSQSNPWKLGEYIAMSKAIVSQRLVHQVPGDFAAGQHYLEFDDPDECIEKVRRLLRDHQARYAMMLRNHAYYHTWLRPDMLVWNSLQAAWIAAWDGDAQVLLPPEVGGQPLITH